MPLLNHPYWLEHATTDYPPLAGDLDVEVAVPTPAAAPNLLERVLNPDIDLSLAEEIAVARGSGESWTGALVER
jgi:hypothetical protein